jgi:MFS family permease
MTDGSMRVSAPRRISAFSIPDYRIFWSGAFLSNIGMWLQGLTVPYLIFQMTSSVLWLGIVAVAQFIPQVLMSPLGGSLADRYDRRKILIVAQSASAFVSLCLWLSWILLPRQPVTLLVFIAIGGLLNGIILPSWQAVVNDIVPRSLLVSAVTLNSLQFNAARAVGPGIAGVLIAVLGPEWALLLNAVSYSFVIIALVMVHPRPYRHGPYEKRGVLRQTFSAIQYIRDRPAMVLAIAITVLIGLLGNPVFAFTVVYADTIYSVGPIALGALNVAFGVGAVMAAPFVSGWFRAISLESMVRYGLLSFGSAMITFALIPVYWVGLVSLAVIGGAFLAVVSGVITSIQVAVSDDYRGRVMALRMMLFTLSFPIGGLIQGWLADRLGPPLVVAVAGVAMLGITLFLAMTKGPYRLSQLRSDGGAAPIEL